MSKKEKSKAKEELNEEVQDEEVCKEALKFKQDMENLQNEICEQKEKFLRIVAEYDNYRKRTERDRLGIFHDAVAKTILEILPVADSLSIAVKSEDGSGDDYKKGLELVNNQLSSALEKLSVEPFGNEGEQFNPEIHNAIAHVDDDNFGENVIVEVFQTGYKVGDKIIRHAMVKVAN